MNVFDVDSDARRVYEVLVDGGIGIIPTDVGYVILGITSQAIWEIFRAKRRKPEKLNAMCGCREMQWYIIQRAQHCFGPIPFPVRDSMRCQLRFVS